MINPLYAAPETSCGRAGNRPSSCRCGWLRHHGRAIVRGECFPCIARKYYRHGSGAGCADSGFWANLGRSLQSCRYDCGGRSGRAPMESCTGLCAGPIYWSNNRSVQRTFDVQPEHSSTLHTCSHWQRAVVQRAQAAATPFAVGAFITAAYWFTASTSFANPAVTLARTFTNTFAGIRTVDAPAFVVTQFAGAMTAVVLFRWLAPKLPASADHAVFPAESRT